MIVHDNKAFDRGVCSSALIFLLLAACGHTAEDAANGDSSSGGSSTGGSASGGASSGKGGSSAAGFSCPAEPPAEDAACTPPLDGGAAFFTVAQCSWGEDRRTYCRTTASCYDGLWNVTQPTAADCEEPLLPASCPESPATPGTQCSDDTLSCWYDDGTRCRCLACEGGFEYPICRPIDPPEWTCATPVTGCPNPPAQAGEPCSEEGLDCSIDCTQPNVCQNGRWQWAGFGCPICASPDTPIATPSGERAIAALRVGDLVYSVDDGAIRPVPVLRTSSTPVAHHRVVRLLLDDGAVLEMSPGHPTADGRPFSELESGAELDHQHIVVAAEIVPYEHDRTHDILPASSSGSYFAAGAQVGSTLASHPR